MTLREWTVLPHEPIEKLNPRLWTVSGRMPRGNQRRMVVVRRDDGSLLVHNAVALGEAEMKELDEWGEVDTLIVPNGFHRMDAFVWKQRYPKARIYCPRGAAKAIAKVVPVDGDYSDLRADSVLRAEHLDGLKDAEGVFRVVDDEGVTLIFNDALLNMESQGMFSDFFLAPVGTLSVPRFCRFMWLKDASAFVAQIQRLADSGLRRVIVAHGATIESDARARLDEALSRLGR